MKKYPKVFVIILNRNGGDQLKKCLTGVFKSDYPNFEAIMVDNGSDDGSFEFAKVNFSKANLIRNEADLGYAAGNNIGIRFALDRMADYIFLMQAQTGIGKDFLARMVAAAEKEGAAVASPVIFREGDKKTLFSGGKIKWLKKEYKRIKKIRMEDCFKTQFVLDSAMLVRADVFRKIGLLSEEYFMFYEDVDFSLRARKAGFFPVVFSGSWAYYDAKKRDAEEMYWKTVSSLVFFKKNTPLLIRPVSKLVFQIKTVKNWVKKKFLGDEEAKAKLKAIKDFKEVEVENKKKRKK